MSVSRRGVTDRERFEAKIVVDVQTGCHEWVGQLDRHGYGRFGAQRRDYYAHRFSWLLKYGSLPEIPLELDHLCRNPKCVNPLHLEAVTGRENKRRSSINVSTIHAHQTHCVNGHSFDELNTYIRRDNGARMCKTCGRLRNRLRPDQRKSPRTTCRRGHEFTAASTQVKNDGRRRCRVCATETQRCRRRERREMVASDA